jgi:glycosyltransferase involved in cell wall biosynthesis
MRIYPSLALVVITGNSEHYIRRFIESFQRLTTNIYIVRACGNREPDKSLDIAKELGCKVGEYKNRGVITCMASMLDEAGGAWKQGETYEVDTSTWDHVDDFAAARQMATDMAEADGHDWLMWADTDDFIEPDSADIIAEHLRTTTGDLALVPYRLTNNGLNLLRERLWRRGTARWEGRVHEHLEPHERDGDKQVRWEDCRIVHAPEMDVDEAGAKRGNHRNWRIIETIPEWHKDPRWLFYGSLEHFGMKEDEDGIKLAIEALKHKELTGDERYELFLQLALRTTEFGPKKNLLHEAHKVSPWRREALAQLAATSLDNDEPMDALAYARSFMALPVPEVPPWTHRPVVYGFGGVQLYSCCLRANGQTETADKFDLEWFKKCGGKISVCHPTRGRPHQAAETRKVWLERAKDPQSIEYIFGMAEDDDETRDVLGRFRHALSPAGKLDQVGGNAVANYNAAVRASTGQIIVTAQDDIEPELWWDEKVWEALKKHLKKPAALSVKDGHRTDDLLVTFVVTRPTLGWLGYGNGILSDDYHGIFSDTEFSHRTRKRGVRVESDVLFKHNHPFFNPTVPQDAIYGIENSDEAYQFGAAVFRRRNPDAFDSAT